MIEMEHALNFFSDRCFLRVSFTLCRRFCCSSNADLFSLAAASANDERKNYFITRVNYCSALHGRARGNDCGPQNMKIIYCLHQSRSLFVVFLMKLYTEMCERALRHRSHSLLSALVSLFDAGFLEFRSKCLRRKFRSLSVPGSRRPNSKFRHNLHSSPMPKRKT